MSQQTRSYFELLKKSDQKTAHPSGKVIFEAGQPGKEMYVVVSGAVDLTVGGQVVDTIDPGEIFGELALVDNEPRSATAVTRGDTELVAIDEKEFQYMLQRIPFFGLEVMRVMAARIRRANKDS